MAFCNSLNLSSSMPSNSGSSGRPLNMNLNIPISFMPILSFCPFAFALSVPIVVLTTGSPSSVSGLPFLAFTASVPFLQDFLIWISFVAFLYGDLLFWSSLDPYLWHFCLYPIYSPHQVFLVYVVYVSQ